MKDRPILFSGPMVRAILEGTKSQTRRVVKPQPGQAVEQMYARPDGRFTGCLSTGHGVTEPITCPHGEPGDQLWVREAWAQRADRDHMNGSQLFAAGVREAWYWADGPGKCARTGCAGGAGRHRAARFMPRWASRLTLRITGVRVERLQLIGERDSKAEGCEAVYTPNTIKTTHREAYRELWEQINGKGSWDANPWVWVIEFERAEQQMTEAAA